MKIKEFIKEGFWSGLGNLAHAATLGATGALKNAPSSMSADTRLAADPSKLKAIPKTFVPKQAAAAAPAEPSTPGEEKVSWDPKKRTLTISGPEGAAVYQKTKTGWKDFQTDEIIAPADAKELDNMFDIASGKKAAPAEKVPNVFKSNRPTKAKPIAVKLPSTGIIVTKSPQDGIWRLPSGEEVTTPEYVEKLEARARSMGLYSQVGK